jgi:uncharacterized protein (DUF1786 family)
MNAERILALDVGAGTTDILVHEPGRRPENAVKLVVPSRTVVVANRIRLATEQAATVVFYGPTMGGGACTAAMRAHLAAGHGFLATESAALTFADDLGKVTAAGVGLIRDVDVHEALRAGGFQVRSGDVDLQGLLHSLTRLGVNAAFDGAAIAAQDHGFSPTGSNRVLRFARWEMTVARRPRMEELFYLADEIPEELTRLRAAAATLEGLWGIRGSVLQPGIAALDLTMPPVIAADTGPAALLGALPDDCEDAVLINVGNGHTVCAVAVDGRLTGVFEHHTGSLDGAKLEGFVRRFLAGELPGEEVLADGGHGAVLAEPAPRDLPIFVTGPCREMLALTALPVTFAAPHGDMMLTGAYGLVRAYEHRLAE